MSIIIDVFLDAFLDTIKLIPFLFLTYFLMEYLEHRTKAATQQMVRKAADSARSLAVWQGHFRNAVFLLQLRVFMPEESFLCERFWLFFFPPQMRCCPFFFQNL